MENKLWTRNFTIITVGTAVSLFGNAISTFATGLLILDYTGSVFLFAIYMILYNVPQIFMPTLAGPYLDKFSRRRAIYTLDFCSAAIYGIYGFLFMKGDVGFVPLLIGCTLLGIINSVYNVAYDSFYPMLISEGNMRKGYSVSSTMESLIMVVTPLSVYLYHKIGIAPLFFINMVCYFIAATFETQIEAEEKYVIKKGEEFGLRQYKDTFKEGMEYLRSEPGLMCVALYFMFMAFSGGGQMIIGLPYFRETYGTRGEYIYIFVEACLVIGRVAAGAFHYRHKLKPEHKFAIAMGVYLFMSFACGIYLFMPIPLMMLLMFCSGIGGMTSYNIRIASTQHYVPDEKKGRYNGTFQMMNTFGMMAGEFLSGFMGDRISDKRMVVVIFCAIEFIAAWVIMFRGRREVGAIYNQET